MRRGISLIELIIAIGIAALLGSVVLTANLSQLRAQRQAFQRSDIETATRQALRRVVKTIRDAQPSSTGGFPIVNAGAQSLTIFSNIDADAGIEQIRFFLNGTNLQRGVIQPVGSPATYPAGNEVLSTVANNIRNGATTVFDYFDKSYLGSTAALTQPVIATNVRLIQLSLTIDADTTQPPIASTLQTNIQLRNLKDNY